MRLCFSFPMAAWDICEAIKYNSYSFRIRSPLGLFEYSQAKPLRVPILPAL